MKLTLVPKTEPSEKEKIKLRIKKYARPDGMIQCNRCGSRTMLTTRTGAVIRKGRITGGTVIDDKVCAMCWKQGIWQPMLPALEPVE